jgi:hypothetical protein
MSAPTPPEDVKVLEPTWNPDLIVTTWRLKTADHAYVDFHLWPDGRFRLDANMRTFVRDADALALLGETCTAIAAWSAGCRDEMPGQLSLLEAAS